MIPEGEGWSISSLLLPLKSASSGAAQAEMLQLRGCPIATRSAIHVVEGSVSGGGGAPSGPATADGNIHSDKHTSVVTRLLLPLTSHGEKNAKSDEPSSWSSSISDFLQEKLWDVVDDTGETELSGKTASGSPTAFGDRTKKEDVFAGASAAAVSPNVPAVARLDHSLSGRGGTRGVSIANLVNMHQTLGSYVDFLQPVPYFMVPLFGTLRARLVPLCSPSSLSSFDSPTAAHNSTAHQETSPLTLLGDGAFSGQVCRDGGAEGGLAGPLVSLVQNVTLTPGEGRRPAVIEARLWVPAASTLVLGFDFFKRFLVVDDFPPDPSRGFDVPPPLARFSFAEGKADATKESGGSFGRAVCEGVKDGEEGLEQGRAAHDSCLAAERGGGGLPNDRREGGRVVYAYGEAGLLDTPQPDFSMPFNVITFTSTVITFFLGTIINLLVRKSKKRTKNRKGNGEKPSQECRDESGSSGGRSEEEVDSGRWFDKQPRLFSATFGFLGQRRGESVASRRNRKEVGAADRTGE